MRITIRKLKSLLFRRFSLFLIAELIRLTLLTLVMQQPKTVTSFLVSTSRSSLPSQSSSLSFSVTSSRNFFQKAMTENVEEEKMGGTSSGNSPFSFSFAKYHGIGNDFILIDNRDSFEPLLTPSQSVKLCDRNYGIGGDGVIFVLPGKKEKDNEETDYTMRIYNSDGSEPEMCGNGIRCMAQFLPLLEAKDKGLIKDGDSGGGYLREDKEYSISTLAGVIRPLVKKDGCSVTVDMGEPIFTPSLVPTTLPSTAKVGTKDEECALEANLEIDGVEYKVTTVSMGNPHAIVFVENDTEFEKISKSLSTLGPKFESHNVFPKKTNTEFVQVLSPTHLKMCVWERGAGATLACGTGACALTAAAILAGKTTSRECLVSLPGGDLTIEWRESDNKLYMTGPGELVFTGQASI